MVPVITPVRTSPDLPVATSVVIIGGGIVGLTAALYLAERGVPVTVLEKGRIAGEQSSRNLGWIRKMGRAVLDVPLAMAADRLWAEMPQRLNADVGYRQEGIMYIVRTPAEMAFHDAWLKSVQGLGLDPRLLSAADIDRLVPGGRGTWEGGILTPSDGRAEPQMAASAIAAALATGAIIVDNCAVRTLVQSAGHVSGVMTERGEIRCGYVILAGGLWSHRFLDNLGVSLPTLPLICSALRTAPMEGPTEIAVGAPDFSFRRRADGGYTITQRGTLNALLTLDHALISEIPADAEGRAPSAAEHILLVALACGENGQPGLSADLCNKVQLSALFNAGRRLASSVRNSLQIKPPHVVSAAMARLTGVRAGP